jgi:diguanylate cyclase (GGDEF)-like protein
VYAHVRQWALARPSLAQSAADWRLLLTAAAFLAAYGALERIPESHRFLGGLAYHLPPLAALCLVPAVLKRTRGSERLGWLFVGLMLLSWDAAEWVYSYYSLVLDAEAPIPSLADWLYYAGYLAFAAGLPLFARSGNVRRDPRSIVDAAVVVVVAGSFWIYFVVAPDVRAAGASIADLVLVGYPLLDMVLLVALVMACYGARRNFSAPVLWMLAAVVSLVLSDLAYSTVASETVAQASLLDLGWLAGYWFIALALSARAKASAATAPRRAGRPSTVGLVLPYLALAPLLVTTILTGSYRANASVLTAGLAAGVLLVMLRQWLTLFENQRLYDALEAEAEELERLRQRAAYQATHDELTGLLNRRAWLEAAMERGRGTVLLLDIDNFKRVNDIYGHPVGDAVLRGISERLLDAFPAEAVVGRLGGEEFGVLLADSVAVARERCEAVLQTIERSLLSHRDVTLSVTLSAGAAAWSGMGDRARSLQSTYERADAALYTAKRAGRNRVAMAA